MGGVSHSTLVIVLKRLTKNKEKHLYADNDLELHYGPDGGYDTVQA